MIHKTYQIPSISCGHCTATIERELAVLPGLQNISADANTKQISLNAETDTALREAENLLTEIGYPPVT